MALQKRDIPLDDGTGEDYEIEVSRTESTESYKRRQSKKPSEMHEDDKILLWAELSVLLNPAMANRVEQKVKASLSQDESQYVGSYIIQHESFILNEMQWKLREHDLKLSNLSVRSWLRFVSQVFKAAEATGIEVDANTVMAEVEKLQRRRRQRTQKPKELKRNKQGKKQPVFRNGELHRSIAAAVAADPTIKYDTLQKRIWRESNKNSI
jgi:hypothetical protein